LRREEERQQQEAFQAFCRGPGHARERTTIAVCPTRSFATNSKKQRRRHALRKSSSRVRRFPETSFRAYAFVLAKSCTDMGAPGLILAFNLRKEKYGF
jgi:hypothetical protein